MNKPATQKSFMRRLRRQHRQVVVSAAKTNRNLDRHLFGRFERLLAVKRFVISWIALVVLLIACVVAQNNALGGYYQTLQPVPGGIFEEGILGTFTNANPIYATNDVDSAVSKLIFAGLFKYDNQNHLVGDLAQSWQVDKTGETYTVTLKPHLTWQDGQPLTADDVVFTYHTIQNPDAESPLRSSWAGIDVSSTGPRTVVFKLPNPLSSFVYNMTNGIVPAHLLQDVPASGLRSSAFNTTQPVGAGPFAWHDIQVSGDSPSTARVRIGLVPFEGYWAGTPKLQNFTVDAYAQKSDLLAAYRDGQLTAMAGLDTVPKDIAHDSGNQINNFMLTAAEMVFFRTDRGIMKDKNVRQGLVQSADPAAVIAKLGYAARPVREPVLRDQFAYDPKYAEAVNQPSVAAKTFDKAGWKLSADGLRHNKDGQTLSFNLVAPDTVEAHRVGDELKAQWRTVGVMVDVQYDDNETFHNALLNQDYDSILYGIAIGADPDVYVYWDSSQNDVRSASHLNLSGYNSSTADLALEAGRTRTGEALRTIKYREFLKAWQADVPALGLYQPRFLYISHGPIYGLEPHELNVAADRYGNVSNWMIRTAGQTRDN
jgi:peptide/nickel transport system substrate-binding protein